MSDVIRDPRYVLSFAVLICVIAVSAVLGRTGTSASSAPAAPAATATVMATATASGPSATDAALDTRRRDDLSAAAAALETYRAKHGGYPPTNDEFGTLCAQAFDAGCLLTTVTSRLAASDGTYPYWYRSNGTTYTLFTRLQTPLADDGCPSQIPPALASMPVFCLSGGSR